MNPRVAKELHPLLLPWCVAAVCAGSIALGPRRGGEFASFLMGLAAFGFFGSTVLLAASSLGTEFQERTLPLLLSQPFNRSRLWNEKLLAVSSAMATLALVYWLCHQFAPLLGFRWLLETEIGSQQPRLPIEAILLAGTFLLATICSAGFWSLLARSTIGGMVLSLASQFLIVGGVVFVLQRIYGSELPFEDSTVTKGIVIVGLIYSAVFLWLGWRKFAHLELRDVSFGEGTFPATSSTGKRWWSDWLRCRPTGRLRNLVRKELRLQKPLFMVAAVFSACWLFTLALLFLQPTRQELYVTIFNALTGFYVPLMAVLAGCMSLSEEKMLGLMAWHLTLPVSAWRQWLLKLSVALVIGAALGLVLPGFLAWITATKTSAGLVSLWRDKDNGFQLALIISGLLWVLSFWAATFLASTVRAALTSAIALTVLFASAALGHWCGQHFGGLEIVLFLFVLSALHWPPDFFNPPGFDQFCFGVSLGLMVLMLLVQSLIQFRVANAQRSAISKYLLILSALAFGLAFFWTDFAKTLNGGAP